MNTIDVKVRTWPLNIGDVCAMSFKKWKAEHSECYIKNFKVGKYKFTHCSGHNQLYMREQKP